MESVYGIDWFAQEKNKFGYSFDGRLGTALGILAGRKAIITLTNNDCICIGFEQETCNYNGKDVTAETVQRLSSEAEVRRMAEKTIGTLLYNLMSTCERLTDRVAELEEADRRHRANAALAGLKSN